MIADPKKRLGMDIQLATTEIDTAREILQRITEIETELMGEFVA